MATGQAGQLGARARPMHSTSLQSQVLLRLQRDANSHNGGWK